MSISEMAGVIGVGRMGAGIAARLAGVGRLASVWDSQPISASPAPVLPIAQMAKRAEILLFAVPTTGDIRTALSDVTLPRGCIVVDLTTSDPEDGASLAIELASRGVGYLDAAMTGGAQGAQDGTLTLMIGGEAENLDRARTVLECFATRLFHLGPAGHGQAMKLVHNAILHATFLATCEGLRMAERVGIDAALAVAVLNAGNARSYVSEVRFPRDVLKDQPSARSAVATLAKDLALAEGMAARLAAPAPYTQMTAQLLASAQGSGDPTRDFGLLFREFDGLAGKGS
jgi:3-hydroxyisobutyrate dehydrogenase